MQQLAGTLVIQLVRACFVQTDKLLYCGVLQYAFLSNYGVLSYLSASPEISLAGVTKPAKSISTYSKCNNAMDPAMC